MLDLRGNPGGLLDEAVLERQPLPARGRSRRLDRLPHPGPQRPQDRRRHPAEAPARRPDRPQHRLRGGDPHRGAGRRRRRAGGRHPLLRQGRLPGGEEPRQRRRPEADGRRVLHPRRGQPGAQPRHPPRRQGQRRPGDAGRRGRSSGRSACSPVRSRVEPAPPGPAGRAARAPRAGGRASARPSARRPRDRAASRRRATRSRRCCASSSASAASAPRSRPKRAEAAAAAERDAGPRRDLTALATFTVDPATARDFDDAVSAQREGDGARVWIHIADVAAHVRPGSPLDLEARRRANSTYVPGAVEPMLPHALSSDACSLAPGVERLAVTAEIELGPGGEPRSTRFYRSRIRSDARLDYDQLDAIFAGRAAAAGARSPNRSPPPARSPPRSASTAAPPASTSNPSSRSSASTPRATSSAPTASPRPRPTG